MKIVVIGGTGFIGSKLVARLREMGHGAVGASPDTGVNTLTGEGLREALAGAEVVVDVSNSPSLEDAAAMKFFETSTRNLLAEEKASGVRHHVALSVVGTDRLQESGYLRALRHLASSVIPDVSHALRAYDGKAALDQLSDAVKHRFDPILLEPVASYLVAEAKE